MMMMVLAAAAFTVGCSSSSGGAGGGNELDGTVGGKSIALVAGISATHPLGSDSVGVVAMSTAGDLCHRATDNIGTKGEIVVEFELADVDASGNQAAPTAAGNYTVTDGASNTPGHTAGFKVKVFDQTCTKDQAASAAGTGGSITLDKASNGVFSGTFDVMLSSGDTVTGTFDPDACPALGQDVTMQLTCQ